MDLTSWALRTRPNHLHTKPDNHNPSTNTVLPSTQGHNQLLLWHESLALCIQTLFSTFANQNSLGFLSK